MERLRSSRENQVIRDRFAETQLSVGNFVYPYFVVNGSSIRHAITGFDGVFHFSIDRLCDDIAETCELGITAILLFGVVESNEKDMLGSAAYRDDALIARAVTAVKNRFPQLTVMTDVCLCGYTDHGHCGVVRDGIIINDETLPHLSRMAVTHARAGADVVAPSAMMDGQVQAIRNALMVAGQNETKIMGYSAKYASSFYGPFRTAASSAPAFGDRRTYQMDYRNGAEAIAEVRADIAERADIVMVKPAHAYLDVIQRIRSAYPQQTIAAYHVSGEYMLLKNAAKNGLCDERAAFMEVSTAIKRAGTDIIISYWAKEYARMLREAV
ncbi:MAG: porphobilinogen synthase [Spirochaetes bacterium]|nr:porphobilinogen synthase [Spirochaetota bacterium]